MYTLDIDPRFKATGPALKITREKSEELVNTIMDEMSKEGSLMTVGQAALSKCDTINEVFYVSYVIGHMSASTMQQDIVWDEVPEELKMEMLATMTANSNIKN